MGFLSRFKAPKATISIVMDKSECSLREPVTGKFQVSSSEEFDADEIRMELWVTEFTRATGSVDIGEDRKKTVTLQQDNKLHDGKIAIAGRMHIADGFSKDFLFSINFPPGVPPSYRGRNATNTWKMWGVIAVKGRPDVTSHDMEVQVRPLTAKFKLLFSHFSQILGAFFSIERNIDYELDITPTVVSLSRPSWTET